MKEITLQEMLSTIIGELRKMGDGEQPIFTNLH